MEAHPDELPKLEEMTDILDIDALLQADWTLVLVLITILAVIILSLIGWLLYRFCKKRRVLNRDELLTPEQKVYLELRRLDKQGLVERREYRKYYFFLSDIFRHYIADLFDYPAIDKTTQEICHDLPHLLPTSANLQKLVTDFVMRAEAIKFANRAPDPEEPLSDREALLLFVAQTKGLGVNQREAST